MTKKQPIGKGVKMERVTLPTFYPESIPTAQLWDAVEVHPTMITENGIVEQCEADEAGAWSVYLHLKQGGLTCIADCPNEALAKDLANVILLCSITITNNL